MLRSCRCFHHRSKSHSDDRHNEASNRHIVVKKERERRRVGVERRGGRSRIAMMALVALRGRGWREGKCVHARGWVVSGGR